MSGYTDKIYLQVSKDQLDLFETHFDNRDPASGVFQQTPLEKGGQYICVVDTNSPDFEEFSRKFRRDFARFAKTPKYKEWLKDPQEADVINLYNWLAHPEQFMLTAWADPDFTVLLEGIFKKGETMFVEETSQGLNRLRFEFDPHNLTDDQRVQLKKFRDSLNQYTDEAVLQNYGAGFMKLFVFARENMGVIPVGPVVRMGVTIDIGEDPRPKVMAEVVYPKKIYMQVTGDEIRHIEENLDNNNPDSGAFVQTGAGFFGQTGRERGFCYIDTVSPDFEAFSEKFRANFAALHEKAEYKTDYSENPGNLGAINLYERLKHPGEFPWGFTITVSAGSRTTDFLKQTFKEGETLFDEGIFEKSDKVLHRVRISFEETHLGPDERAQLRKFHDSLKFYTVEAGGEKVRKERIDEEVLLTYGPDFMNLYLFAAENLGVFERRSRRRVISDIPVLIEKELKDDDPDIRSAAAEALGKIGPAAKEVVPALIEALKDADPDVRSSAAMALGEIGPAAKEAVPAVAEVALKDADVYVRRMAVYALAEIGPVAKEVVSVLAKVARKDADPGVRYSAIVSLACIRPVAKEAVSALAEAMLKDADVNVRDMATMALRYIGPAAKEAVSALAEVARKDADDGVRYEAVVTLGSMGPEAKEAVPALTEIAQKDPDPEVRAAAEEALKKIVPETNKPAPGQLEMPESSEY